MGLGDFPLVMIEHRTLSAIPCCATKHEWWQKQPLADCSQNDKVVPNIDMWQRLVICGHCKQQSSATIWSFGVLQSLFTGSITTCRSLEVQLPRYINVGAKLSMFVSLPQGPSRIAWYLPRWSTADGLTGWAAYAKTDMSATGTCNVGLRCWDKSIQTGTM